MLRILSAALLVGCARAYLNTVMPNGECNITSEDGIPVVGAQRELTHVIPTAWNPNYGAHVVVLGRDSKLYHKHQLSVGGKWSPWKCLTPDFTKVPCSVEPHCSGFDNNPAVAWQPKNGTLVVFARQKDDLTLHEIHLEDPTNPDSWSSLRGPACLCNFPPCANQTKCGAVSKCDGTGPDCKLFPGTSRAYWNQAACFPTSDITLMPEDDKLTIYFRGFDGAYYKSSQLVAGDTGGKYGTFNRLGGSNNDPNSIIE